MGPFDDLIPAGGKKPSFTGYIPGTPKPRDPLDDAVKTQSLENAEQALINARLEAENKRLQNEKLISDKGARDGGKPLPKGHSDKFETDIGLYSGLSSALSGFQDDFAGNTVTGGLENTIQGLTGFGTEGQRDWWAQFKRNDNQIRNDLFGATLTPSEQASYASTTVAPDMAPSEIKRNLKTRKEIIQKALKRKRAFFIANGYSQEAVDALAGEYTTDLVELAEEAPVATGDKPSDDAPAIATASADKSKLTANFAEPPADLKISETGEMKFSTDADKQYAAKMQAAFDRGASEQELLALASSLGAYQPQDLRTAISYRDKGGKGARIQVPQSGYNPPSALGELAASDTGAFLLGQSNAVTLGAIDEIAGLANGDSIADVISGTGEAQMGAQLAKQVSRENSPPAALAGEVSGGLLSLLGTGFAAAKALPNAGRFKQGLAGDVAYGAGYGALENNDDRLIGAATGAALATAGNLGGNAVAKGIEKTLAPSVKPIIKRLTGKGLKLTPGQIAGQGGYLGRVVKGIEDRAAGFPVVGELVNSGRRESIDVLNRVAIDEALAPIGAKLPDDVATGFDAVAWGQKAYSDAYSSALDPLRAQLDNDLVQGLQATKIIAQQLPDAQKQAFDSIIAQDIAPFWPQNGVITGKDIQAIKQGLDAQIANTRTGSPADKLLAKPLEKLRDDFLDFAKRADPARAAEYEKADEAFSLFTIIENAASKAKGGVFSPEQLRTAVRQADKSSRKKASAAGNARMQGLSDDASQVLPSSVPDSGTAGRIALAAAPVALGGGAGYADGSAGTGLAVTAALALPFTRTGRSVMQAALTGNRPDSVVKAGQAIGRRARVGGAFGSVVALEGQR
jgi:hypothetical protein